MGNQEKKVQYFKLHLDSLKNVKAAAADFLQMANGCLNVLICNAGERSKPCISFEGILMHD